MAWFRPEANGSAIAQLQFRPHPAGKVHASSTEVLKAMPLKDPRPRPEAFVGGFENGALFKRQDMSGRVAVKSYALRNQYFVVPAGSREPFVEGPVAKPAWTQALAGASSLLYPKQKRAALRLRTFTLWLTLALFVFATSIALAGDTRNVGLNGFLPGSGDDSVTFQVADSGAEDDTTGCVVFNTVSGGEFVKKLRLPGDFWVYKVHLCLAASTVATTGDVTIKIYGPGPDAVQEKPSKGR